MSKEPVFFYDPIAGQEIATMYELSNDEAKGAALYDLWRSAKQVHDNYSADLDPAVAKMLATLLEMLD